MPEEWENDRVVLQPTERIPIQVKKASVPAWNRCAYVIKSVPGSSKSRTVSRHYRGWYPKKPPDESVRCGPLDNPCRFVEDDGEWFLEQLEEVPEASGFEAYELLRRYGRHDPDCRSVQITGREPRKDDCDCGYNNALQRL